MLLTSCLICWLTFDTSKGSEHVPTLDVYRQPFYYKTFYNFTTLQIYKINHKVTQKQMLKGSAGTCFMEKHITIKGHMQWYIATKATACWCQNQTEHWEQN